MRHTISKKRIGLAWSILALIIAAMTNSAHAQSIPEDKSKAVILAYHRIGEDAYPDTNLSEDQFDQHLNILLQEHYTIMPLPDIIKAWDNDQELPVNTVAITFEGAYRSAYKNGMKKLIKNNIPFTVFYAHDSTPTHNGQQEHLDRQTLKTLSQNKDISIGALPAHYSRHAKKPKQDIQAQINKAITYHKKTFAKEVRFFSYPFGEFSKPYTDIIKANPTFKAALTLNSAVSYNGIDRYTIPRFSMTEPYGSTERFLLITKALPLPAHNIHPAHSIPPNDDNTIGFSITDTLENKIDKLSCFVSGQDKPGIQTLRTRVEIRPKAPLTNARTRINCTLKEGAQWRWFGLLLNKH